MKLYEIIESVDILVPNSVPAAEKIKWINNIQRTLYRDYPVPEAVQPLIIKPGVQFYPLPENCAEDRITEVVINDRTYPYITRRPDNEDSGDYFCTFVAGTLMIYPPPAMNTVGYLYFKPRPVTLTTDDMQKEPEFPADFHELLVFGCASRVALTKPETTGQSQEFDLKYRQLAEKADLVLQRKRTSTVNITRRWM